MQVVVGGSAMATIKVVEVQSTITKAPPPAMGYGRDGWEARAQGGLGDTILADDKYSVVTVRDRPPKSDRRSEEIALAVCRHHAEEDDEIPKAVQMTLRRLLERRLFATAVRYTFEAIWDRGFELDLAPKDRTYLGSAAIPKELVADWVSFSAMVQKLVRTRPLVRDCAYRVG